MKKPDKRVSSRNKYKSADLRLTDYKSSYQMRVWEIYISFNI